MGNYLKPTAACHTKTSKKKKIGIKGNTSTVGAKALYASGNSAMRSSTKSDIKCNVS